MNKYVALAVSSVVFSLLHIFNPNNSVVSIVNLVLAGFLLGILQDSMSPLPLGITSFTNSVIGFAAGQIRQFKLAYNAQILASVILILVQGCVFFFFYQFLSEANYGYLLLTRVFPNTIYTFLIGLLISFFYASKSENI